VSLQKTQGTKLKKLFFLLQITIFILISYSTNAQLNINVSNVDFSKLPALSADINVRFNGVGLANLNQQNFIVLEKSYPTKLRDITNVGNGNYKIQWVPNHDLIDTDYNSFLYVSNQGNIANAEILIPNLPNTSIRTRIAGNSLLADLDFGLVIPNTTVKRQFTLSVFKPKIDKNGFNFPTRVDSISIFPSEFKYVWQDGNLFGPPPTNLLGTFEMLIDVTFTPRSNDLVTGQLVIHYEGGAKRIIYLSGNKYRIESPSNLKLKNPKGNETFTPCQQVSVEWTGHAVNNESIIEYSIDNGLRWIEAGKVRDSVFIWTVPNNLTNQAKLRVRQEFLSSDAVTLKTNESVNFLDFNQQSTRLLSYGYNTGSPNLEEWDMVNIGNRLNVYNTAVALLNPLGAGYIKDNEFMIAYLDIADGGLSFEIYSFGNSQSVRSFKHTEQRVAKVVADFNNKNAIVSYQGSGQIKVFSLTNGELVKSLSYPFPITSISVNRATDLLLLSLLNGEIHFVKIGNNDFEPNYFQFLDNFPYPTNVSISNDGKIIGISCKSVTSQDTQVLYFDKETGFQIGKPKFNIFTDIIGIDFNPNGTMSVAGHEFLPQVNQFDILNSKVLNYLQSSSGRLTGLKYAFQGGAMVTSAASERTLVHRSVSYPEASETDTTFSIEKPIVRLQDIETGEQLIFSERSDTYNAVLCNDGTTPIFLNEHRFKIGAHFRLRSGQLPDVIQPGDCKNFELVFMPKDTGRLEDTLFLKICEIEWNLIVGGTGLNRKLTPLQSPVDFGEQCIGDTSRQTFVLFRNDDNIPIRINGIGIPTDFVDIFKVSRGFSDTLLAPGELITATLLAIPDTLGEIFGFINVFHSNQSKYFARVPLKVTGIGSYVDASHRQLAFIPEIRTRQLRIKNSGSNIIEINRIFFSHPSVFSTSTAVPLIVNPNQEIFIDIIWTGANIPIQSYVSFEASPCIVQRFISLVPYSGFTNIQMPDVSTSPLTETFIDINYRTETQTPYQGVRDFEMQFRMNPRLFYPTRIESSYGNAELISVDVEDDLRVIKFKVNGNFPVVGTMARIHGFPGLAETASSNMTIDESSFFFGVAHRYSFARNGVFRVIDKDANRRILHTYLNPSLLSVFPNPADNNINLVVEGGEETLEATLDITNSLGIIQQTQQIRINKNQISEINIEVANLPVGSYKVSLKTSNSISTQELIIIR